MATNPPIRPGDPGYDELRSGFNIAIEHRPDLIVDGAGRQTSSPGSGWPRGGAVRWR